ncbi:MAG: 30S ribosomal protein S20 [Acaryochloridaceae cyanobacterium SU_2_1]|nr:30S ribosomal protein S20 [Acaryochloridaceae cyanobacterium SU_2_1]
MANIKSAKKRILITERNRLQNKAYKSAIKTFTKRFHAEVDSYTNDPTAEQLQNINQILSRTYSKIDKAVKTGVYHRNTGARKKAGLAKRLSQKELSVT